MACPECGSWAVKADRSLSGRLVCGRCGLPLGVSAAPRTRRPRSPGWPRWRRRGRPSLWLLVLALLAGGALLTAVVEHRGGGRLWRSPDTRDPAPGESGIMYRNIAP